VNPTKPPNEKQRQQAAELCGASVRALTGLRELRHRGRSLFLGGQKVNTGAPHSALDPLQDDFVAQRGAADGIALRLLHSDAELHRELAPEAPIQRLIFDLLEQLRVETMIAGEHPGVRSNVMQRFRDWSLRFHDDGHADTELGLLIYTIAQVAWSRLTGYPTLAETDDLIEVTRGRISALIGTDIAGLRRERLQQAEYAVHALVIARIVDESLLGELNPDQDTRRIDNEKALSRITLALDFTDESEDSNIATIVTGNSKVLAEQNQVYRIYNRDFDRELRAASQVRDAELRQFREQLDARIFHQGINVPRLARQISQLLATPRREGWLFGQEEGLIDGRRLSQLIATPSERRLFRKDQYLFKNDCQVSFLIDCSGSMKSSIEYIAMLVDVFARALDQADIASEILGFTTGDWNGGRVYQQWQAEGRPQHPGRLNERCHLVFKNASDSWRKSRRDIAALLKTPYFREGFDGEAVEWACSRLRHRDAGRRILMVISDGSPMDSATNLANDEFYLDNHLKHMIEKYDNGQGLEIYGIGVGLSLTPYYRHCMAIDLNESLSNHVFTQILQMIAHAQRR
jgi:cobaltochelatase CobT